MKKLVCSAIALSLTSAAAANNNGDRWSTLDQEVDALTASLGSPDYSPMVGGFVNTFYANSSDVEAGAGNDLGGFTVLDARIRLSGERAGYSYRVEYDFAEDPVSVTDANGNSYAGESGLLDAYIDFPIGTVKGRVGQFRAPVARDGLIDRDNLFFVTRTEIGALFATRDEGAMLSGDFDQLGWYLTIQNGSDDQGDELFAAIRVAFDFMGEGVGDVGGSYDGPDDPTGTAAISYYTDGESDADGILGEAEVATNVYSFGGTFVDLSDDDPLAGAGGASVTGNVILATFNANNAGSEEARILQEDWTPWTVYGTYMLTENTWEVGVRYQDFDDDEDSTLIDVAINHYVDGHGVKWFVQFSTLDTDDSDSEGDIVYAGASLSF